MVNLARAHAVITGGGSGIGLAIATALANQGTKVTLMGRNADKLSTAAASMETAQAFHVDVSDPASIESGFRAAEAYGPIDILVNNAGIAETVPFHKTDFDLWQRTLSTNLTGVFLCTQQAYSAMRERKKGRIINIASTAGQKGYAYASAYVASKHGVIGLTRALALECANTDITVNAICPGFTDTDIVRTSVANIVAKTGRSQEDALAELTKYNPQNRLIDPQEIAHTVLWLCSDTARSVTGQSITIAGGEIM